jgi:hypothetical protein
MFADWKRGAVVLALAGGSAFAQFATPLDPDWKEVEAPPPPALRTQGLIDLEIPRSALRYGIDPASITLGPDGIVRYVVVAQSPSGTVNAMYEGLHCKTAEVKVYARHNPDSGWVAAKEPAWMPLHGASQTRHSLVIARGGACMGHGPNRSVAQIVRDLRAPVDTRFYTN